MNYRRPIVCHPLPLRHGEGFAAIPLKWIRRHDERALIFQLICDRRLFGCVYDLLQGDYFQSMPPESGVFLTPLAITSTIVPGAIRPGDIDILVIPYEGDEIILERTVAIEVKVVRGSFANQGKSPNEFGFSQSHELLNLGFPYVALVHLIVSDQSPPASWKKLVKGTVATGDQVVDLHDAMVDTLPSTLIDRCYGRLLAHSNDDRLGLVSAYLGDVRDARRGTWFPSGREALFNPQCRLETLKGVAHYFERNPGSFLPTPRHSSDRIARA